MGPFNSALIKCSICGQEFYDYVRLGHCIKHDYPCVKPRVITESTSVRKKPYVYTVFDNARNCLTCGTPIKSNARYCCDCNEIRHRESSRKFKAKRMARQKSGGE